MILKLEKHIFIGRIMELPGKRGIVKVKFHEGMRGQAFGARVELFG